MISSHTAGPVMLTDRAELTGRRDSTNSYRFGNVRLVIVTLSRNSSRLKLSCDAGGSESGVRDSPVYMPMYPAIHIKA